MLMGKGIDISKKRNLGDQIKDIPASKRSGLYKFVIILLISSIIWLPLLINVIISGSFIGINVDEQNLDQYTGYAKFEIYAFDNNQNYQKTNGTMIFYDYYTEEQIGNGSADGTVYQFTNVTVGYLTYIESIDGFTYPNKTFLIYANDTIETATINKIYVNPIGNNADFGCTFFKIAKIDGSAINYGNLGIADITALADKNFTMSLNLQNNGNGSFGENYFIPTEFRYNESIYETGLWIRFNILLNSARMGGSVQNIYFDGLGNTYFYLPTLNGNTNTDIILELDCQTLPTNIQIIQGQWNSTILKDFS